MVRFVASANIPDVPYNRVRLTKLMPSDLLMLSLLGTVIQALVTAGISSGFAPHQIERLLGEIHASVEQGGILLGRKSVGMGMGSGGIARVRRVGKVGERVPANQATFYKWKLYAHTPSSSLLLTIIVSAGRFLAKIFSPSFTAFPRWKRIL